MNPIDFEGVFPANILPLTEDHAIDPTALDLDLAETRSRVGGVAEIPLPPGEKSPW